MRFKVPLHGTANLFSELHFKRNTKFKGAKAIYRTTKDLTSINCPENQRLDSPVKGLMN